MRFFRLGGMFLIAVFCMGIIAPSMSYAGETRTVVDDRGVAVQVPAKVKRVATVCIPYAQIVWALDASARRLVGMHASAKVAAGNSMIKKMAPEIMEVESEFTKLGSFVVNVEELLKLNPDVVFQWTRQKKEIAKLEAAGLTVIGATNQKDINEVPHRLRLVGKVLGEEERAEEFIAEYRKAVDFLTSRVSKLPKDRIPLIIHLYNVDQLRVDPLPWYKVAGGRSPVKKRINVTMEQILKWNPEVIFISNFTRHMPEDFFKNRIKGQEWSQVDAVKKGRVYKVPLGTYRWGPWNAETTLMLWWVAKKLHPELFKDYTIEGKIRDFYKRLYNYKLSPEEIKLILNPIPSKGL